MPVISPGPDDEVFEQCTADVRKAIDAIDARIDQIESSPAEDDFPKMFWTTRRDAIQRAYNALLGQIWIEHYRRHGEIVRTALERAHVEGRLIHAWESHIQEMADQAIVIGSPPPLTVDEALRIHAREPDRIYITLNEREGW